MKLVFLVYLGLLGISFFLNHFIHPFYNQDRHNLRSFQIIYLVVLIAFWLLVLDDRFELTKHEFSTLIIMSFSFSFFLIIASNLSQKSAMSLLD